MGRDGDKVTLGDCEKFVSLRLEFASEEEVEAMSSEGAMLVTAAADGDKKSLEKLLKDGVDVNSKDWDQMTALTAAASGSNLDVVKLLIKKVSRLAQPCIRISRAVPVLHDRCNDVKTLALCVLESRTRDSHNQLGVLDCP